MLSRKQFLLSVPALALASQARAQSPFSRPVRFVLSTSPGGGADVTMRLLSPHLTERLGQSVVIESKPGASGLIAGGTVAREAADGYTFLVDIASHSVNPALGRAMPYKVLQDLVPVTQIIRGANALALHPSVPAGSLAEFIAYAKQRPGQLSYASSGNGSAQHLAMEIFKERAGLDMTHVPYRGGGPALVDLMAGHVQCYFAFIPSAIQHIREGRIKAVATTGETRAPAFPELPTIAEAGFTGFSSYDWNGVFAPARTPEPMMRALQAAVAASIQVPEVRARILDLGSEPVGSTAEEFRAFVQREIDTWSAVVQRLGITAD
ncbi:tripartite tricarboxylate transporter substrate binding protein [Roseococcus sp. SYP-B2431]|uniref:Bug family tripartite tricarboxylate transporter substrate binding protein n=1 Tax=Roseococcus sp. SYP-B2431 TaxID=2496640 RepID=UPI0013F481F2|nr:tripartite tricarboxylate transporter substrate binding protein [Roseococcus sp. SYP-B2431]